MPTLTTQPLARAIAGAMLISLSGIWVALADVPPTTAAFFRCAYALPLLAFVARREPTVEGRRHQLMGVAAGVCFAADLILWHLSIDMVGAGLATLLASAQLVIVPLVSWLLLGERPSQRVLTGLPVVVVGVVVISGVLGGAAFGDQPVLGTIFGAGAGVAYAGFLLALRQATAAGARPAGALRDASAGAGVIAAIVTVVIGNGATLVPAWPSAGWLLILGVGSQVVAWLLITSALGRLPGAISSLVLTLQPVAAVGWGAVLLAERPSALQLGGAAVVLVGIGWASGARPPRSRLSGRTHRAADRGPDRVSVGELPAQARRLGV